MFFSRLRVVATVVVRSPPFVAIGEMEDLDKDDRAVGVRGGGGVGVWAMIAEGLEPK